MAKTDTNCQVMPNDETKTAMDEYEEMKRNPEAYKRYGSFDELVKEVVEDV